MSSVIWVEIPGLEGHYSASNTGLVRRNASIVNGRDGRTMHISETYLKTFRRNHGHLTVDICLNSRHKPYFVHRLVALAFIPNLGNKPFINHKDSNPENNFIDNLEWCTQKENMQHSLKSGRMVIPESKTVDPDKLVQVKSLLDQGLSKREIARRLNICRNTIKKYFPE